MRALELCLRVLVGRLTRRRRVGARRTRAHTAEVDGLRVVERGAVAAAHELHRVAAVPVVARLLPLLLCTLPPLTHAAL